MSKPARLAVEILDEAQPAWAGLQHRLLTPEQVTVAARLHRLGLFTPQEIARILGVPAERLARSFRVDLTAADGWRVSG